MTDGKAFETWTHAGHRYLAIRGERDSVRVIDERGVTYGACGSVDIFRAMQRAGTLDPEGMSRGMLSVRWVADLLPGDGREQG